MVDYDEQIMFVGIGIFALFIFFLEPYATTRALAHYFLVAGYVGLIGIIGVVSLIVGTYRFLTKGSGIYLSLGVFCIIFTVVVSSWPIELLLG